VSLTENGAAKKDDVSGLVPEIYYDLIARIAPGVLTTIALLAPHYEEIQRTTGLKLTELSFTAIFFLVGFGYIVGHLLTTISLAINFIICEPYLLYLRWKGKPPVPTSLRYPFHSNNTLAIFSELYERIDLISKKDRSGGVILKKMEAGSALTDNLVSGWIVLVIYVYVSPSASDSILSSIKSCPTVILGTVFLCISSAARRAALIMRHDNLLRLNYKDMDEQEKKSLTVERMK
jgi:hypothetical protein